MISENLDELSPLLRTAFVLREVEGYSTGEAAKKLGVTENTLKARLWRARHQLAERLGQRLRRIKDDMAAAWATPSAAIADRPKQRRKEVTRQRRKGWAHCGPSFSWGTPRMFDSLEVKVLFTT